MPGRPNGDDYVVAGAKTRRAERQPQNALVRDYKRTSGRVTGDGWHRADKHLRIVTFRALNDLQREYKFLNPEEFKGALTDALDTYVHEDLKNLLNDQAPGELAPTRYEKWALIDVDRVDHLVEIIVGSAVKSWDRAWIDKRRTAGAQGGRISRRSHTWDQADLDRLRPSGDLYGLNVKQQQEAFKCSERTISRMRAEVRIESVDAKAVAPVSLDSGIAQESVLARRGKERREREEQAQTKREARARRKEKEREWQVQEEVRQEVARLAWEKHCNRPLPADDDLDQLMDFD